MSKELIIEDELLKEIALHTANISIHRKYENSLSISGWVLNKPKLFNNPNNQLVSGTIVVHQFVLRKDGDIGDRTFSLITYSTEIMEELNKQEHPYFICANGIVNFNIYRKQLSPQILDISIPMVLPDYDILPPKEAKK